MAANPICSIIKESPGPDVTVIAWPPDGALIAMEEAISSSIWMNIPPTEGKRAAILSTISVEG